MIDTSTRKAVEFYTIELAQLDDGGFHVSLTATTAMRRSRSSCYRRSPANVSPLSTMRSRSSRTGCTATKFSSYNNGLNHAPRFNP
jgi:hypothetical protein